jgi:hypothetical protein
VVAFDQSLTRDPAQPRPDRNQRAGARRRTLQATREMALIRAEIFVAEMIDVERMAVRGEKAKQLVDFGVVSANRVRAAVGLELKPSEIFISCGLQGEGHVEAAPMIVDG